MYYMANPLETPLSEIDALEFTTLCIPKIGYLSIHQSIQQLKYIYIIYQTDFTLRMKLQ